MRLLPYAFYFFSKKLKTIKHVCLFVQFGPHTAGTGGYRVLSYVVLARYHLYLRSSMVPWVFSPVHPGVLRLFIDFSITFLNDQFQHAMFLLYCSRLDLFQRMQLVFHSMNDPKMLDQIRSTPMLCHLSVLLMFYK